MVVMAEMAAAAAPWSARQDAAAEQASSTSSRPSTSTRSASGSLSTRPPPSELPEASPRLPPPSPTAAAAARGFFSMACSTARPRLLSGMECGLWIGELRSCGFVTERDSQDLRPTTGAHKARAYDMWAIWLGFGIGNG
jgi:hypothetical protein